jgi:hypothetical protein
MPRTDDIAAGARSHTVTALKLLSLMWEQSPIESVREECRQHLCDWLVALRSIADAPDAPEDVRADARRALNGFHDA